MDFNSLLESVKGLFMPKLISPEARTPMTLDQAVANMASSGWREVKPQAQPAVLASVAQPQAPVSAPAPAVDPNYRFDFDSLLRDQDYAQNGPRPGFQPAQPPQAVADLLREFFPNEATAAAAVMASENGTYDPNRADNVNAKDGSVDRGIPQINSNSFNGLMQRQGNHLRSLGVNSFEDMRDPRKSFIVADLIRKGSQQANPQTNGWGPWFGWQDTGYDLNKGYFSQPKRIKHVLDKKSATQ